MKLPSLLFLLLPLACPAQTIQGNVQNGTSGAPAAGSLVLLYNSSGEQGRAITRSDGSFQINGAAAPVHGSHGILEVIQDGVEYFQPVRPGQPANVKVYNAASQVRAISSQLSVLQFESKGDRLQVTELHAFNNASNPPITKVSQNNLEVSLPQESRVQPATVSGPDGGTTRIPLVRIADGRIADGSDQYRVEFPIKPGVTKYALSYDIPYDGSIVFRREAQYAIKRLNVIVPESMRFRPMGSEAFHEVGAGAREREQVLDDIGVNEHFAFELSGTGGLVHSFHPSTPVERSASAAGARMVVPDPPAATALGANAAARHPLGIPVLLAFCIVAAAWVLLKRTIFKRQARI
jgi:hypothetical protein